MFTHLRCSWPGHDTKPASACAEVADIDAGQSEATALRQKQNAEYQKSSSEYKQSADAVANAIQTLQAYALLSSSGSFLSGRVDSSSGLAKMVVVAALFRWRREGYR